MWIGLQNLHAQTTTDQGDSFTMIHLQHLPPNVVAAVLAEVTGLVRVVAGPCRGRRLVPWF